MWCRSASQLSEFRSSGTNEASVKEWLRRRQGIQYQRQDVGGGDSDKYNEGNSGEYKKDKGEECNEKRMRISNWLIRRYRLTGEIRNGWSKWKKRHGGATQAVSRDFPCWTTTITNLSVSNTSQYGYGYLSTCSTYVLAAGGCCVRMDG